MCDIDFFMTYNDAYGHPAGDQALRTVAAVLTEQVRKGDRVYRYGGEEFLVLLPEQDLAGAGTAMERTRERLHALAVEHRGAGPDSVLTISVGLAASHPDRRVPSAELLAEADTALYEARTAGRTRVAFASTAHGTRSTAPH